MRVAKILAVLSIAFTAACAVVFIGAGRFNVLYLGFEFVGVVGTAFFAAAALTGVSCSLDHNHASAAEQSENTTTRG
jgi:hypothetical protein